MAYFENEKSLTGDIPADIRDTFSAQWKSRGHTSKKALSAAIKLWISLPTDIQSALIDQETDTPSFITLVHQIVDKRIAEGLSSAQKSDDQKKKRGLKD